MIHTVRRRGTMEDFPRHWFKLEAMKRTTHDFSHKNLVGQSQYTMVYHGQLPDRTPVAIKRFKRNAPDPGEAIGVEWEAQRCMPEVMQSNVRKLLAVSYDPQEPLIVYEYLAGGTLKQHLQGKKGDYLKNNARARLNVAWDVATALHELHDLSEFPIYHRDVKSANVLLANDYRAKLADTGIAVVVKTDADLYPLQRVGSKGYTCPVYMKTGILDEKTDVYSFGVLLMELVTCSLTTYETKRKNLLVERVLDKLRRGLADDLIEPGNGPDGIPLLKAMLSLASRCCSSNLSSRPTVVDVAEELSAMYGSEESDDEFYYHEDGFLFNHF